MRDNRAAATRARILDAVVTSIDEVGFARTTSQQIARAAGVSVGAVQHHFPAKDDILAAVLERSIHNLEAQFDDLSVSPTTSLADRIDLFVERAWRHYGSAAFRSTSQILTNARTLAPATGAPAAPIVASARGAARLWKSIFGEIELSEHRHSEIRQFAFAALTGMADANRFRSGETGVGAQLAMLKTALGSVFETAYKDHRARSR